MTPTTFYSTQADGSITAHEDVNEYLLAQLQEEPTSKLKQDIDTKNTAMVQ
jgi:hypothetical protein